ncbi:hypothetical protein GGF40_000882 [Coemansia sp. RSA 1286]|nr:hypothetical protein GGF40_000882 [Coemansia sp. RSA 1286]
MEQELILSQGISAQSIRAGRRRGTFASETHSRPMTSRLSTQPATPPNSLLTHRSWSDEPSVFRRYTRPAIRSPAASSSPQIPLRMLLPSTSRMTSPMPGSKNARIESYALPDHFACSSASSSALSRESINSRFSEVQVEYIEGDCLIHNGMQMVDFGMEFAAQRATPRLVSFPHTT